MTVDVQPRALAIDGAEPVRTDPWPTYDKGDVFIDEEDLDAALAAVRARLYFRYDQRPHAETQTGRFERDLAAFFGVPHALACSSGTAAIALALLALDLPPGSLVACPAFTFAATPSAILLAGHRPLPVECDDDLHLDVADLRRRLTPEVRAIVVVHMRGFASDMEAVCAAAREHGVPVVEDAVPALGARLNGRPLGTFGDAGAFSTQSDKSLNTGEGGFLVVRDPAAYARAVVYSGAYEGRMARHFDGVPPPGVDDLAMPIFSLRMDEIRAALARAMLRRLPERLAAHHRNYDDVAGRLADVPGLALRRPVADHAYLGEALVFRLPGADARTTAWTAAALRAEGIDARALGDPGDTNVRAFWNWRFLFPDARSARERYPATAARLDESIDVPLSANLTARDRDHLVEAVRKVLGARTGRP
ncbi:MULTISPECIES: DegT/DnrJ/EryC1/StrS family aminotransferase [Actinomadura]|uniref:DegT/DnrJ/EryC1/StrS family aminotransferase n=1 Tax=Actinomadura yumaensis TaxID=111807 RepID=A0ABW2CMS7_9ACTN|nr:aminotransferase class I/II-fold pyridoxal phosphate-dependent enzyme [Actinomadura sp. J1-007]MWK32782.1 aminotransferase class I/II-fold pyridoxal phosphate-dependent enzyme [Actinomadura sp. J1-007]